MGPATFVGARDAAQRIRRLSCPDQPRRLPRRGRVRAQQTFDGAAFTVCAFDPRHDDLRLFWKSPDDKPFGSLGALAEALQGKASASRSR